ncbi:MAG: TonB-dependent receptor, partial [Acidobacteria bacterium]|nr:TonB-dependent receptor [Acidobacteriota bacterium]
MPNRSGLGDLLHQTGQFARLPGLGDEDLSNHNHSSAPCIEISILAAQESRGTVTGRVTDSSGASIPNVTVRLVNTQTSAAAAAQTNAAGNYAFPFVIPGAYALSAELAGFKAYRRENVPVRVNDVVEVNIQLSPGDVAESVQVTAEVPLLETGTSSVGQVVDSRRITELPTQAGNPFELVMLAPGVVNTTNVRGRKTSATNATSQLATAGNPQYSNEFTIDGIPNTFAAGAQPRVAFVPPQSSVSEFRVQTTGYEAYTGHTSGSVINVNTQGGTNVYHGEVHHFLANSALDAPNFFQNRSGQKKQVYQDNRYGLSIGGPARRRGKTFFFYTWEENRWGVPRTLANATVPNNAQRQGDLSQLLALGAAYQVYDPATTTPAANGRFSRQPFAGNLIPASRIDPVARNIAKYWPQPNFPGTREGRNNYSIGVKDVDSYKVHLGRLDHNFSDNHRVFLRLHYDYWDEDKQQYYLNETTGVHLNRANRGLAFDDVYVLNPSTVVNLRYGLTQQEFPERRRSQGFDLASLGFSANLLSLVERGKSTFPLVGFGAVPPGTSLSLSGTQTINAANNAGIYSGFGGWETGDGANTGLIHSFQTNWTTLKGDHSLRYGADFRLYRAFAVRLPFDVAPALSFVSTFTRGPLDTSAASPVGQELASFLLGLPEGEMRRSASYATKEKYLLLYLQDDWKLTRELTVNLGLRYDYESPMTERFDRSIKG